MKAQKDVDLSILAIAFVFFTTIGCGGRTRVEQLSPEGDKVEYSYEVDANGLLDGESVDYFHNGQLRQRAQYEHGNLNGVFEKFHENGRIFVEAEYSKGALMNIIIYRDSNGVALPVGGLRDGEGNVNEYDMRGQKVGYGRLHNGWFDGYFYLNSSHGVYDSIWYEAGAAMDDARKATLVW